MSEEELRQYCKDASNGIIKLGSSLIQVRDYIKYEWFKRTQLVIIDKSFQEWELIKLLEIIDKEIGEDK